MASTRSRDPGVHRRIRRFAALDAIEEVFQVIDGAITIAAFRENGILIPRHYLTMERKAPAIDLYGRLRTAKLESAIVDLRAHRTLEPDIKTGVAIRRLDGVRAIPFFEYIFVGQYLCLSRLIRLHGPVHNIDPVRE